MACVSRSLLLLRPKIDGAAEHEDDRNVEYPGHRPRLTSAPMWYPIATNRHIQAPILVMKTRLAPTHQLCDFEQTLSLELTVMQFLRIKLSRL